MALDKVVLNLQKGNISEALMHDVETFMESVLHSKRKISSQDATRFGLSAMKLMRGCVQILTECSSVQDNILLVVKIATSAYECICKIRTHDKSVPLSLEKLIFHIMSQLLRLQLLSDALSFAEFLKVQLEKSVFRGCENNDFDTICKQSFNQIWKVCASLEKSSKHSSKYGITLTARQYALMFLILASHDVVWVVDQSLRAAFEYEHSVNKDHTKYQPMCNFLKTILSELLKVSLKEKENKSVLVKHTHSLFDLLVQYCKCCLITHNQNDFKDVHLSLCNVLEILNEEDVSILLTAIVALKCAVELSSVSFSDNASKERVKPNSKQSIKSCLKSDLNQLLIRLQQVKKLIEMKSAGGKDLACLVEALDVFRKQLDSILQQSSNIPTDLLQMYTSAYISNNSVLSIFIDILEEQKHLYLSCADDDKMLSGKQRTQLLQRCISRQLGVLSFISVHSLRQLQSSHNHTCLAQNCWRVCKKTEDIIEEVSEGNGGALSKEEHKWLGGNAFNFGIVLYKKEHYMDAEPFFVLASHQLLKWSLKNDNLDETCISKVSLWDKFELLVDCQRRTSNYIGAMQTICTVLQYMNGERCFTLTVQKWLEVWGKVKRDVAKVDNEDELRSKTILDMFKDIGISILEDNLSFVAILLQQELKLYEKLKYDSLLEQYAVVCDLLELYQGDDCVVQRAVTLIKLAQLLRSGRLDTENLPTECVQEAISILDEALESEAVASVSTVHDALASAYFWIYIHKTEEENLQQVEDSDDAETQDESSSHSLDSVQDTSIAASNLSIKYLSKALHLWKEIFFVKKADLTKLSDAEGTLNALLMLADLFNLHQLPLQHLDALQCALHLSEYCQLHTQTIQCCCSLVHVVLLFGNTEVADYFLHKAQTLLKEPSLDHESETYLRVTWIIAKCYLLIFQEKFCSILELAAEASDIMSKIHRNYKIHTLSADLKAMLVLFSSLAPQQHLSEPLNGSCMDPIDLCPQGLAMDAMKLYMVIAKGVMGEDMDSVMGSDSSGLSGWAAFCKVLSSLQIVGELYTLQGCVRQAKCYLREGLNLGRRFKLARWIMTFYTQLGHVFLLQGLEDTCSNAISNINSLLDSSYKPSEASNTSSTRFTFPERNSKDLSADEDLIIHTKTLSLLDDLHFKDNTNNHSSPCLEKIPELEKVSLVLPTCVNHLADCSCELCIDLTLHRLCLTVAHLEACMRNTTDASSALLISDKGLRWWEWMTSRWPLVMSSKDHQLNTFLRRKPSKSTNAHLHSVAAIGASLFALRADCYLQLGFSSQSKENVDVGMEILSMSKLDMTNSLSFVQIKYLNFLICITAAQGYSSLKSWIQSLWPSLVTSSFTVDCEIVDTLDKMTLEEHPPITKPIKAADDFPQLWQDSITNCMSRPELSRKHSDAKEQDTVLSYPEDLGLFGDILNDEMSDNSEHSSTQDTKIRGRKGGRKLQAKSKKGKVTFTIGGGHMNAAAEIVGQETEEVKDVFSFDGEGESVQQKKRGKAKSAATSRKTSKRLDLQKDDVGAKNLENKDSKSQVIKVARGQGKSKSDKEENKNDNQSRKNSGRINSELTTAGRELTDISCNESIDSNSKAPEIECKKTDERDKTSNKQKDTKTRGGRRKTLSEKPSKAQKDEIQDSSKEVKKPRRRGRTAATENVRSDHAAMDDSFHLSDNSLLSLDSDDAMFGSSPVSCHVDVIESREERHDNESTTPCLHEERCSADYLNMTLLSIPLRTAPEASPLLEVKYNDFYVDCEEIEIPRAKDSDKQNGARRKTSRKVTKKNESGQNYTNVREILAERSDCVTGDQSITQDLEVAFRYAQTLAPCPLYRHLCQMLALSYGVFHPEKSAYYLTEAFATTLRHQKLSSVTRKLRKLKKHQDTDVNYLPANKESSSEEMDLLLQTRSLFTFESCGGVDIVSSILKELPDGWCVCQLSVVNPLISPKDGFTETSNVLLTRFQKGQPPIVVKLAQEDNGLSKKSATDLLEEIDEVMTESKNSTKETDKRIWWSARQSLNDQMQEMMSNLEEVFFGSWKGLLLSAVKGNELAQEIDDVSTQLEKVCRDISCKPLTPGLLKVLVNSCAVLSRQELINCLAFVTAQNVGTDELSGLVAIFEQMTQSIKIKVEKEVRQPMVLILDKQLQHVPWESMPTLRPQPVFRMPSVHFLVSHLQMLKHPHSVLSAGVNPDQTYYVLNPSNDLVNTQKMFQSWFEKKGWNGVTGRVPAKEEYTTALTDHDLFIYCGHGNGREYFSGDDIQRLSCQAVTLLIGCSSGKLLVNGMLDASGMALSYILAGCPCVLANLWDVTDRDIDRFLEHLLKCWLEKGRDKKTLLEFVSEARNVCKLPYLIGSAPVMYGLPPYIAR